MPDAPWETTSSILDKLKLYDQATAWQRLEHGFRAPIERLAARMGLGRQDAEDAAQLTLVAFAERYRDGAYARERGSVKSWLFGIARLQVTSLLRRVHDRARREGLELATTGFQPVAGDDLEAVWDQEWRRALLDRCLRIVRGEVSSAVYDAFCLFVLEGLPADEVAGRLGIERGAVYNAKHRITRRLRELADDWERG